MSFNTRNICAAAVLGVVLLSAPETANAETECRRFEPGDLEIVWMAGHYGLAQYGEPVLMLGGSRAEARVALFVILHYGINELCGVGGLDRPVMVYFLANRAAPRGRSPGEDCTRFDQAGGRLRERDGYWVFGDRNQDIVWLGRDRGLAVEAVSEIRTKNFSEICRVGGENGSLSYFVY